MGPQINVIGSFFPSWMLVRGDRDCGGICSDGGCLYALGLDPYVGPPALVYSSLGILVTLVLWVTLFRG